MLNLFLFVTLLLAAFMTLIFVIAMRIDDNSIVDIAYGLAFVLVGWSAYLIYATGHARQQLLLGLITIWGLRLASHIFVRKLNEDGEDARYRKWRKSWGENFVWRSFLQIYMLQGAVVFFVVLPFLLVIIRPDGALNWIDFCGVAIWLLGFSFEAIGDYQLLRFKKHPGNRGKIMQYGLWRFTRHPNYFGEATLWWGVFLIALNTPYGLIAIISPLLIDFLLLKVSGIPMLEAKYVDRPDFEEYKQQTNAFFPWFPKAVSEGPHA